jgi:GNAT superfamily N-acetyltransferase
MIVRHATSADVADAARIWNQRLGTRMPLRPEVLSLTLFEDRTLSPGDVLTAVDDERVGGRGFGRQLLDASLVALRASGVERCTIDWTRLLEFYARFGFSPLRAYLRGHKRLTA